MVPEHWLSGLLTVCAAGDYDKLSTYVDDLMAEGYAGAQVTSTPGIFRTQYWCFENALKLFKVN